MCGRVCAMAGRAWSGWRGMVLMARVECRCERRHGEMESGHPRSFACMGIGGKLEDNGLAGRD